MNVRIGLKKLNCDCVGRVGVIGEAVVAHRGPGPGGEEFTGAARPAHDQAG